MNGVPVGDEREESRTSVASHSTSLFMLPPSPSLVLTFFRVVDVGAGAAPSLLPMRHYGVCLSVPELASSAKVLTVRAIRSAAGYPVDVYGHVFVRGDLDGKRVYLFRRGRDNCQTIHSKLCVRIACLVSIDCSGEVQAARVSRPSPAVSIKPRGAARQ